MGVAGDARTGELSSHLDHLPAVLREPAADAPDFLGRFLLAFEQILTGLRGEPGLDQAIDAVPRCLDPIATPAPFLDWLAGWVAMTLRPDLDAGNERRERARALVAGAVPLYRMRGTRRGLEALVRLLAGGLEPTITEPGVPLQVNATSRIGVDTRIGGGLPHLFHVLLRLPQPDPAERRRAETLIRAILDAEKPAHTRYSLDVLTPAMQIGVHAQIGVDTLLSPGGP